MILQGLFNILDLYITDIDLFYDSIDSYFQKELMVFFGKKFSEKYELFQDNAEQFYSNPTENLEYLWNKFAILKDVALLNEKDFKSELKMFFEKSPTTLRDIRHKMRELRRSNHEEWKKVRKNLREQYRNHRKYHIQKRHFSPEDIKKVRCDIAGKIEKAFLTFLKDELIEMGFTCEEIENRFLDPFLEIDENETEIYKNEQLYRTKIAPIIYEIFLEKIADYLADNNVAPVLLNLKSKGYLPIEFVMELRDLKKKLEESGKIENFKKYIRIKDTIINKLQQNKTKIENLEDLEGPKDKLQLLYILFRIIDIFHMTDTFDLSHLKEYLRDNIDEYMIDIPLITLKNPEPYFCGLYLANELEIEIDKKKVKNFLSNLYEDIIDEFESPIIEATDGIYYFMKATQLAHFYLSDDQLRELIKVHPSFFQPNYLKDLETSQLVVIMKVLNLIGLLSKFSTDYLNAIIEEIKLRITKDGIKQFREGFESSEASYYVLFYSYMTENLSDLQDYQIVSFVVDRIYRNIELLELSQDTNIDLLSETVYSVESLKLLNCIETKQMITHLANYLFPNDVVEKILNSDRIARPSAKFRHFKVNRITGEIVLPSYK